MIRDYDPELYDILHPGSFGDIEWYRKLAGDLGGPVLELGAGTGRTLLPIARDGIEIHGLEENEEMLAALRNKVESLPGEYRERVRCFQGDMRDFELPHRYRLITIPFRAFLHNRTRKEQLACLVLCHRHLLPGGSLALNVFHPSLEYMSRNTGAFEGLWRWIGETEDPRGGRIVQSMAAGYDTVHQQIKCFLRYEHVDDHGRLQSTHLQRLEISYLYPGDLRDILGAAGFVDLLIEGGFEGGMPDKEGCELVVRARKPEAGDS